MLTGIHSKSAFRGFKVRKDMKRKQTGGEARGERMSRLEFVGEADYDGEYFEGEEEEDEVKIVDLPSLPEPC